MRIKYFLISVMLLLFTTFTISFSQLWTGSPNKQPDTKRNNFYEYRQSFNDYWEAKNITPKTPKNQRGGWMMYKRWEWFWEQRTFPTGNFPDPMHLYNEYQKLKTRKVKSKEKLQSSTWQNLGPETSGGGYAGLGRLNCIIEDPDYNGTSNRTIWVGAASGGLWKTTDDGANWSCLTDNLPSLGVSSISINPSNKSIMYIATGDGDHADCYSAGVLKSTDGGSTWNTTGLNWTINQTRLIRKLIMHPSDYNILYAATSVGIYKTTNAGTNWTQMSISLSDGSSNFWDVEFKPGTPNTVYASSYYEIVRTTNGGSNWSLLSSGLPAFNNNVYRIELAVTPDDGNYIYAVYGYYNFSGGSSSNNFGLHGVYKSTNGGTSWTEVLKWQQNGLNLLGWNWDGGDPGGQAFYDLTLSISPTNKNNVFIGGVNVWFSSNGGTNWGCVAHWWGQNGLPAVHADQHHLSFAGSSSRLYAAHDGGINRTSDNGTNWSWLGSGLKITQLYRLGVSQTNSDLTIAGAQDNGTKLKSGTDWNDVIGGDGMECLIDYNDAGYKYGSRQNGILYRSVNGAFFDTIANPNENGAWVTPYVMHPTNSSIIYSGYKNVWKSTNRGDTWSAISSFSSGTLTVLHVAPSNPNYIYAGYSNVLNFTSNGGTNWSGITLPANTTLNYMAIHPSIPNKIWAVFSGYTSGKKVYISTNSGSSWTNISGTLPNIPVNCIIYQDNSPNRILIGTDLGVFYRDDNTSDWVEYNDGLPSVVVNELEIQVQTGVLYAATFGRGLWKALLPVEEPELTAPVLTNPANNFNDAALATNLTWDAVNSADNYQIQISLTSDFAVTLANVTQTAQTYSLSNITPEYLTSYFWRVRAKRGQEEGPWSETRKLTTIPIPLVAPVLVNPANDAANIALNSDLSWNSVAGADNYQIQVSLNVNFTTTLANVTQAGRNYNLSNISAAYSTQYFWRVRAKRGAEDGPWATARNFTTEPIPLIAPVLTNPADNILNAALNTNLTWNSVNGADNYQLMISLTSDFATFSTITQTAQTYSLSNISPEYSTTYFWKVRAKRGAETGPFSVTRSLTTMQVPLTIPVLVSPANNAVNALHNGNLTWQQVNGADSYIVQVSQLSNFSNLKFNGNVGNVLSFNTGQLNLNFSAKYFWRVRAVRGEEQGTFATAFNFTTRKFIGTPTLTYPQLNAQNIINSEFFQWTEVEDAEKYHIQVSELSNFSVIKYENSNVLATQLVINSISPEINKGYYWRVRAINSLDNGNFTSGRFFTTYPSTNLCDAKTAVCSGFISSVSFSNLSYTSSCNWGYSDESSIHISTVNKTLQYSINISATSAEAGTNCGLWIDWNADNDFNDAGENITLTGSPGSGPFTKNITVPLSAVTGSVKARIVLSEGIAANPCGISGNGEVEDFSLNILPREVNPPQLFSPANNAVNLDLPVQMIWDAVNGADSYNLQISEFQNFSSITYQNSTTGTSMNIPNGVLSFKKTYYWRVNTTAFGITSSYSSPWKFETKLNVPDSWLFTDNTGKSSTIRVPLAIDPQIAGRDFNTGDAIGLFFVRNAMDVCAGYGIWNGSTLDITVWGDNPGTQLKDGFADNESYKFKMWDASLNLVYDGLAEYASGPSVFTNNSLSVLSSLKSTVITQSINLTTGWNLISSYISPVQPSMSNVWSTIASKVTLVKNGAGKTYIPSFNINSIGNWNLYDAYQVYLTSDAVLNVVGTGCIPENEKIILPSGWNMVSYLRKTNMNIVTALATLTNTNGLTLAKNNQGQVYLPQFGINGIGNMIPGQGYQLYIAHADTLIYPANPQQKAGSVNNNFTNTNAEILVPEIRNTGENMTLIFEFTNPDAKYDIGVYNSDNLLTGSGKIIDNKSYITVWGADEIINPNYKSGDLMIKAYDKHSGNYSNVMINDISDFLNHSAKQKLNYETNTIIYAKGKIESDLNKPSISVHPNPFSDKCEVSVFLPQKSNITLKMYDLNGKEVMTKQIGETISGKHIYYIESGVMPAGEYNLILNYEDKSISEKVILIK